MDQPRTRFLQLNLAVVAFHVVTTVICVAQRWPAQFGAPSPDVPTAVLILSGVVNVLLSLATLYLAYRLLRPSPRRQR